jgi:Kef-type K+ transport system membrane component KefB
MRARIVRTEGSLLLPALLLAGARLELPEGYDELLLIGTALFARLLVNYLIGASLALSRKAWRPSATWLGFAMSSSGTLTMMVGLALSLGLDEQLGQFVLTCAALGTLFGELLGPLAMRRALERAGEVSAPSGELPEPSGAEVVS